MSSFARWLSVSLCILTSCHAALIFQNGIGQSPLADDAGNFPRIPSSSGFSLKTQQNDTVCDAGSAQWTGHVPLGKGRNMFYWYFESRVSPESAPLVIWTNGGPGGSSMMGAFFEIGPCFISENGTTTARNPHSWTNDANMLFIDQPIGVGMSLPEDESLWAHSLVEGGIDMDKFLDVFLDQLFPELAGRPIHFAGESYGGKYVPVYAAMTRRKFDSIILVDPFVDPTIQDLSMYQHFCPEKRELRRTEESSPPRYLNETACAAMEAAYSRCDKLHRACQSTYDADICWLTADACDAVTKWQDEVRPGGRDPYDDRRICRELPLCNDMGQNRTNTYLNLHLVKQALGLPASFKYESINFKFNQVWNKIPDIVLPSTREITALLDNKHTRVLVINGNNDGAITTEGVVMVFDELPWHGHAAFARLPYRPWHHLTADGSVRGGQFKSYGNLTVVTVDEAGHMSPHDQPEATLQLLGWWLGRSGKQPT